MENFWAENWIELLFFFFTLIISTSFTLIWGRFSKAKKKKLEECLDKDKKLAEDILDKLDGKLENVKLEISLIHRTLIEMMGDSFRKDCKKYLNKSEITIEELSEIQNSFELYSKLGGNGRSQELYNKVLALNVVKKED